MVHKSRGGLWLRLWWVLVAVVLLRIRVMRTGAQKIEVDGLEEDKYNRKSSPEDDRRAEEDSKSKGELKYTVTEEVYLDITIFNKSKLEKPSTERVVIACFGDIAPITCLNFVALAKGYRRGRELLTYKGSPVHRIIRDFVVQMGDVTGKNGRSGESIYGPSFQDESFLLSHRGIGWVSMANHGRDTNGSQFFILLQPARWLDGKHVVFGKVIKGMEFLRKLGDLETRVTGRPIKTVKIENSGVVGIPRKYDMRSKDVMSHEDVAK